MSVSFTPSSLLRNQFVNTPGMRDEPSLRAYNSSRCPMTEGGRQSHLSVCTSTRAPTVPPAPPRAPDGASGALTSLPPAAAPEKVEGRGPREGTGLCLLLA